VTSNKYPKITKDWLTEQVLSKSVKKIAQDVGCSISLIFQKCRKYNITRPNLDLVGFTWKDFTVIKKLGSKTKGKQPAIYWLCECKCGSTREFSTAVVNRQQQRSCGCYLHSVEFKINGPLWNGYGEIHGKWWNGFKKGALKRKHEFKISIEYAWELFLKQDRKCSLSGLPLVFSSTTRGFQHGETTASIDRINNKIGYIESNIQWVHKDVNYMKQKYNQEYFIEICKFIAKHNS